MAGLTEHDLRAFLLGRLEPEARAELEGKMMAVEATFKALEGVEDKLIDDFVQGRLTAEDSTAFDRYCHRRPGLQERIRLRMEQLKALETAASNASKAASAVPTARRRLQRLWIPGAALATGIVLMAAVLLHRGRGHTAHSATAVPDTTSQTAGSLHGGRPSSPETASLAVVFLPQLASRSTADLMPLELHTGAAAAIKLELELPPDAGAAGPWTAMISEGTSMAFSLKGLQSQSLSAVAFVSIEIESSTLVPGRYTVTLIPKDASIAVTRWELHVSK